MTPFDKNKPVAAVIRGGLALPGLLECALALSKGDSFVLLLSSSEEVQRRLLPAYVNARLRSEEEAMRSESMQKEVLLFVAGTMNIGKAIRSVGAVDAKSVLVFASSSSLLNAFVSETKSKITSKIDAVMDKDAAVSVALAGISQE